MSKMGRHFLECHEKRVAARCNRCNWFGYDYELKPISVLNPKELGDIIRVPGCPACLTDDMIEYKEN